MSACHDDILHDGPLVAVRDEWCFVRRSGPRGERYARGNTLRFTRAGMYVLHYGAGGRRTIVADGAHVLLSNDGAPYLVSHPTDDGDASIVLDYRDDTVREVAARHDRAAFARFQLV